MKIECLIGDLNEHGIEALCKSYEERGDDKQVPVIVSNEPEDSIQRTEEMGSQIQKYCKCFPVVGREWQGWRILLGMKPNKQIAAIVIIESYTTMMTELKFFELSFPDCIAVQFSQRIQR